MPVPPRPLGPVAAASFVVAAGVALATGGVGPLAAQAAAAGAALAALGACLGGPRGLLLLAAALLAPARAPRLAAAELPAQRPVVLAAEVAECHRQPDGGASGQLRALARPEGAALDRPARSLPFRSPQGRPPPGPVRIAGMLVADSAGLRLEQAVWTPAATGELAAVRQPWRRLREGLRDRLEQRLGAAEAGLAIALLLGERDAIPADRYGAYRSLGLLHLLAVSGMHLWLWDAMLRRVLPRLGASALRLPLLAFAAALAGGGPPVVRALAMICLREQATWRGRRTATASLWAAALWVELALLTPRVADLGLVLSYAATGALILGSRRPPRGHGGFFAAVLGALRASTAAFLGTAPWLHAVQGVIQPWSIPLTPLLALLMPLRLSLALAVVAPGVGTLAAAILEGVGAMEGALLAALERLPGAPLASPTWSSVAVAALAAALLALLARPGWLPRAVPVLAALTAAAVLARDPPSRPGLLLLPVGHGLGAIVAGADATLVFDLGSADASPSRLVDRLLLPALHAQRWPLPRFHLASHRDLDHVAGLARLAGLAGSRELSAGPGTRRELPGLAPWRAWALGSRPAGPEDGNGRGQILELDGPGGRVVVLGDQQGWSLRELQARLAPGPIEVLVLPHHGLSTDGLPELLDHLAPRQAWASCGAGDLPLPAAPLLARRGIPLRTTLAGALRYPPRP